MRFADASRLACAKIHRDDLRYTSTLFMIRAPRFYWDYGAQVRRVMIDNDTAYRSRILATSDASRQSVTWLSRSVNSVLGNES